MMEVETQIVLLLWILLGAVAGMLYSLKRILRLERAILTLDKKISKKVVKAPVKKPKKKPKRRKKK